MKNKGFTLIELLAVIVILAIIALIAVPIVLNIIEDAKNESNQRSIDLYGTAVKNAAAKYQLNYSNTDLTGKYDSNKEGTELTHQDTDKDITLTVEYDGSRVYCETIEIYEDGEIYLDKCQVNGNSVDNTYGEVEEVTLAPGLYDENDELVMSWDELLENNVLKVYSNGSLNFGTYNEEDGEIADFVIESLTGKLVISDSVISIYEGAFNHCVNLTSIEIPDSVTSIGWNAFQYCTGLKNVKLGEGITEIGESVFSGCTSLTSIEIPDSVTTIDIWAFDGCTSLKSVYIPNSLTYMGSGVFRGCSSLTSIYIPSSVTNMSAQETFEGQFNGCSPNLKIYTEANSKPSGWGTYWNYYDDTNTLSVQYGVTRAEYQAIINEQ